MSRTILERESELATLAGAVDDAARGDGSVVLISGEAGIGKSSLVDAVRGVLPPEGRRLVGYCDDLATPRVLGPFRDLVGSVGPVLTGALERGDRGGVLEALRDEFGRAGPTVLAIEDVHWADEATFDALRYLVRRAEHMPLVLVLTYRDEEVGPDHPLRLLLGLASRVGGVRRLRPARLSADAVRELSAATRLDAAAVYAVTAGNPYFVTEVLAAGDVAGVPQTIAEAVRARVAGLDRDTMETVERLAVVPSIVPPWLVEALVPDGLAALAPVEQRGLLEISPAGVGFGHELARRAVVDSTPAGRRVLANRRVLAALVTRPAVDLSRVIHHATEAGDAEAIAHYGPIAAGEASAAGAHREAAAHLRLVLDQHPALDAAAEADLWERLAVESYIIDAPAAGALAAQRRAVELRRGGDTRAYGTSLRWLSRISWWAGERDGAETAAEAAVEVLGGTGDDTLLAMALSNRVQLKVLAGGDLDTAVEARRVVALSRDMPAIHAHALTNLGLALSHLGDPAGPAALEGSLRVALAADEPEHACRAYLCLAGHHLDNLGLAEAERWLAEGIEFAEGSEFLVYSRYLQMELAILRFATGDWDEVAAAAAPAMAGSPAFRCAALIVVGRTRARRGEPGAREMLREAWRLAVPLREPQRLSPAAAGLAEAAALDGDVGAVLPELTEAFEMARDFGRVIWRAELAYWLGRAGRPVGGLGLEHPYAMQAEGRWRPAAEAWREAGYPYEHAAALAESPDPADQIAALTVLDSLGAKPLARIVRAALRERGVARIPRGPAAATRDNPVGLTARQVEVVRLMASGLSNAEIADRLVLSVRTVESHVAAALGKLGAATRREAAARAGELRLLP